LARLYQFANRQANDEALRLFNSAIELDPDFATQLGHSQSVAITRDNKKLPNLK
jgi:adenylate cyclase